MALPQILSYNGVDYEISSLSDNVKNLLKLQAQWNDDINTYNMEILKTKTALEALSQTLKNVLDSELNK